MFEGSQNIVISTGNVLGVNRKAGQKASEELLDCLKTTLADPASHSKDGFVYRNNDDLHVKVTEHNRCDIKIGAKIFLNNDSEKILRTAIDNLLDSLNVTGLDNLILAYHPKAIIKDATKNGDSSSIRNGTTDENEDSIEHKEKDNNGPWSAGKGSPEFDHLKRLWTILEQYAKENKICQLGIADLDTDLLIELYEHSSIKPAIAQINLSACCVVPPALQEFCNKHDIQLLTHSDPIEIVTDQILSELDLTDFTPLWSTRYQVHIKCRGVLAAKGFIFGAQKK